MQFLRNILNWTSPKNPFWKIEPRGSIHADTVVFAIKMLLDKLYGLLNLLELKCDHFSCLFQAESQFQILAGNSLNMCPSCPFSRNATFSACNISIKVTLFLISLLLFFSVGKSNHGNNLNLRRLGGQNFFLPFLLRLGERIVMKFIQDYLLETRDQQPM